MSDRQPPPTPPPPRKPQGALRVVHTADWHLGKMLGDLDRACEHGRFLDFLHGAIADHEVDLLIVAGDVFDSSTPPQSAQRQYYDFLSGLYRETPCHVLVVGGNHDSPAQLEAPRELLESMRVRVVGAAPPGGAPTIPYPDTGDPRLAVASVPFLRDRDLRTGTPGEGAAAIRHALAAGIASRYSEAWEGVRKYVEGGAAAIATGHLTVAGSTASDSERDIHIGGLGAVGTGAFPAGFGYVALGHLHRPQACGGDPRIRYAGSPIPLSFSEAGDHKEVRIIDVEGGQISAQHPLPVPLSRPLVQLRTGREELPGALADLEVPGGELTPWVELVVENPLPGEDYLAIAREAAADRDFDVVRVITPRPDGGAAASPGGEGLAESEVDDLLGDPARVFAMRLDAEGSLDDPTRERLEIAFRKLLEKHQADPTPA